MLIIEKIKTIKNEIDVIIICFVTKLSKTPPEIDSIAKRFVNINMKTKIIKNFIKNKFFLIKYFELIIHQYHLEISFLPDHRRLMHQ